MIAPSEDYHQIVALFDKYRENKKTRVLSHVGFWRYLLTEHNMPAWIVKNLKTQVKRDPNLSFHLDTIIEDHILTGSLTGTLKEASCKLVLKNKFGYVENVEQTDEGKAATTKAITYRQATVEDVQLLESK
jgi:hypothetical protein